MANSFTQKRGSSLRWLLPLAAFFVMIYATIYVLANFTDIVFYGVLLLTAAALIATLVIDRNVITGYLAYMWRMIKRTPIFGILFTIITVIGLPVVSLVLLGQALLTRKLKAFLGKNDSAITKQEFSSYDLVEDEPPITIQAQQAEAELLEDDRYDAYFDATDE